MVAAARRLSDAHAVPATLAQLQRCAAAWAAAEPGLPPRPPPAARCPGVYAKGCAGSLEWVCFDGFSPFWACSRGRETPAGCSYRLYPPARLRRPQLDLLAVAPGVLEVACHLGAEEAVAACGGVAAVLRCAGADLSLALPAAAAAAAAAPGSPAELARVTQPPAPGSSAPGGVRFPLALYRPLRQLLRAAGAALMGGGPEAAPPLQLLPRESEIPEGTLRALEAPSLGRRPAEEVAARYAALPRALEAALLPFQREGVRFGLARGGRCLIADEMGVGKTVQAIALAACYRADGWPLLVVAPASLRLVWAEELEKWLPGLAPEDIHVVFDKHSRPEAGGAPEALPRVTITSYTMLAHLCCAACKRAKAWRERREPAAPPRPAGRPAAACLSPATCAASAGWRMIVADESHNLRTAAAGGGDALHTEALRAAARRAARVVMLTGTPSLSKPYDLWTQVSILRPGLLAADRAAFAAAYCHRRLLPYWSGGGGGGAPGQRWDQSGLTRGPELHLLLRQEVMVRRLKRDVLAQLPPKRRQVIRLPKPPPEEWPRRGGKARHRTDASDASSGSEEEGEEEEEDGGRRGHADQRQQQAQHAGMELDLGLEPGGAAAAGWTEGPCRPGGAGGGAGGGGGHAPGMSAAHRTGLAKCGAAIDWLNAQLGEDAAGGEGEGEAAAAGDAAGGDAAGDDEDAPPKFIVFAHHRDVMNRLAYALDLKLSGAGRRGGGGPPGPRCEFVRVDGDTDGEGRRLAVERFRSEGRVRVALLSVTAAGVGLDFSAASAVVFVGESIGCWWGRRPGRLGARRGRRCGARTAAGQRRSAGGGVLEFWIGGGSPAAGVRPCRSRARACPATWAPAASTHLHAARFSRFSPTLPPAPFFQPPPLRPSFSLHPPHYSTFFQPPSTSAPAELPSEVSLVRQAEDRAHRQGQRRRVNVYFLCARGTVDERHWQRLSASLARVGAVVDGVEPARAGGAGAAGGGGAAAGGVAAAGGAPSGGGVALLGESAGLLVDGVTTVRAPRGQAAERAAQAAAARAAAGPGGGGSGGSSGAAAAQVVEFVDLTLDPTEGLPSAAPALAPAAAPPAPPPPPPPPQSSGGLDPGAGPSTALDPGPGLGPAAELDLDLELELELELQGRAAAAHAAAARWWFQLSPHTQRVHLYGGPAGARPLGLSLPLQALLAPAAPAVGQVIRAVQRQMEHLAAAAAVAAAAAAAEQGPAPAEQAAAAAQHQAAAAAAAVPVEVVGGVGPVCPDLSLLPSIQELRGALAAARAFAAEWRELPTAARHRLAARRLQPPLEDAADAAAAAAAAAGALGAGTDRFFTPGRPDLALPEGATWHRVTVRYASLGGRQHAYSQPATAAGARLCLHCAKAVPHGAALPMAAPLDSTCLLFCAPACERAYAVKSSGGAGRRALFARERGVCGACGLDAAGMVRRLQAIERGSKRCASSKAAKRPALRVLVPQKSAGAGACAAPGPALSSPPAPPPPASAPA
jgi:hypothetical protein